MIRKVEAYIQKMHMIQPGDRVLVALSGGADSVCLFLILAKLRESTRFTLEAIHVEHGIRGEESLRDAAFVEALCQKHQVPLHLEHVDATGYAKANGLGLEEAARILRHNVFHRYATPSDKLAIAHHMEDHMETVLFQMARGTGLTGLCGLAPVSRRGECIYIRPLLCCGREEIEKYLASAGQDYCTDATNSDTTYSRNRIRHEILPELKLVNEKAVEHVMQMSQGLSEIEDYLSQQTLMAYGDALVEEQRDNSGIGLSIDKLSMLHLMLQKEVLLLTMEKVCGRRKDITRAHIESILALLGMQSGKMVDLPYDMQVVREFEVLRFYQKNPKPLELEIEVPRLEPGQQLRVDLPGDGHWLDFEVIKFDGNCRKIPRNPYTKWFNYDMIKNNLFVRTRREKDYLTIDEAGHQKKLKEYFVEAKIPAARRNELPLIAMGQEILWVLGGRTSENYRVYEDTEYLLVINYNGGHQS